MDIKRRKRARNSMSITPLVDVVFLLLLFFALTLHFSPEEAISVELPTSSSAKQQSETEIILTVTPEGVIRLNGKDVPSQSLETELASLRKIDENGIVLRKATVDPQVTLLTGLTISKMNIGEKVEVEEADALKMTLRMLSAMNKGDLYFKKINVSKVLIRAYIYDTLSVKGTPKELMQIIQRGELQKVVNNLFNDKINRGTIKVGGSDYMSFTPEIDA